MLKKLTETQRLSLQNMTKGSVSFNRPLAPLTSFKIGGLAEAFYEASAIDELSRVIAFAEGSSFPCLVIGKASNILVRDGGIGGLVIRLSGEIAGIAARDRGRSHVLVCGAGAELKDVLSFCCDEGFTGLEFLAGIPGSVGGAIAVNTGAFGFDVGERVSGIKVIKPDGTIEAIEGKALHFAYRELSLDRQWLILEGTLAVDRAEKDEIKGRIKDLLKRRKEKQPLGVPSAGSIFRNPPEDSAGRLIECAGLKGMKRGGAMISPIHANWIVNTGGASADDIIWLINRARDRVMEDGGVELELEIRIVGDET